MARLLFVDDHPLYRAGFQLAMMRQLPDIEVAVAGSAEEALALLAAAPDCDLCLSDVRLPGMDGLALLDLVAERWPTVARAVLCSDLTPGLAARARSLGLVACLSKGRDMDALAEALTCLFDGSTVFDTDAQVPGSILSDKRRRVLDLASRGNSNKQIARELGITERTVKDHWTHIFQRLSVVNRAEAVSEAHKRRLI